MDDVYYALALNSVYGVGSITYKRLVEHFGSARGVFESGGIRVGEVDGVGKDVIHSINSFKDWEAVKEEIEKAGVAGGVKIIALEDEGYPMRLKELYDAPPIIYIKGSFEDVDRFSVSVVGSRSATSYGSISAESIARGLAERGITVISGMARGIDSLSHKGALKGGGRTIAVLGSGVDVVYPPENRKIYKEIIENGAVVSEFPMGTPPEPTNFPRRNRIISGLSLGVVIVEASESSGALITANLALEQNREVFAVPGNITSLRSKGTHQLIKKGARLVESAEDVLEELKFLLGGEFYLESFKKNEHHKNIELTDDEIKVINCITHEPVYLDTIIEESRLKTEEVLGILLELELKRVVRQIPGKSYVLER